MIGRAIFVAGFFAAAAALTTSATAQDAAGELIRRARASEKDNGFCAGASLEKIGEDKVQPRINQLLSANDNEARMAFVLVDKDAKPSMCFVFIFKAAAMKDSKKCRETEVHACDPSGDCASKANDAICEVKPGEWD